MKLTKDANVLIDLLYKSYLQKRKDGVDKSTARYFNSSLQIHSEFVPQWTPKDTDETCWELKRSGMIHCIGAEDIAQSILLTDDAIIYMENR